TACVLLHSPGCTRSRVTVTGEAGTELQLSLVRLPAGTARLDLRCEAAGEGTVRLVVTAHDNAVSLDRAAWEWLAPTGNRPEETSYRPEATPQRAVREWFGDPCVRVGERRASRPIALPGSGVPVLLKVSATDTAGHRVTAFVEAPAASGSPSRDAVP